MMMSQYGSAGRAAMQSTKTIETEADIARELTALIKLDPRLKSVADVSGHVPLRRSVPGFRSMASIIVSQQVSKASAEAITARLDVIGSLNSAQDFRHHGDETLLAAGLSRPKLKTLRNLSETVCDGTLDLDHMCNLPADQAMTALTALSGIGPWTAEVYLLFAAGHPDIFPGGDIALQNALRDIFVMGERPSAKSASAYAAQWSPHRGTAARLLWAWYGATKGGAEWTPAVAVA